MSGKGDKRRKSSFSMKEFDGKYEKIFGSKKARPGRYKEDLETGKFIPIDEWYTKYQEEEKQAHFIQGEIEPYISQTTNQVITSRKQHRYDLEKSGCRVYEGRDSETKEANKVRLEQDKKFERTMSEGMAKTFYQLRDGTTKPEHRIKSSWLVGKD